MLYNISHDDRANYRKTTMEGSAERMVNDQTMTFSVKDDRRDEIKSTLLTVYEALYEKGYNPVNQIVGYILSEDPTYITTYNNARSLIRHIDRDELLQEMVKTYLGSKN